MKWGLDGIWKEEEYEAHIFEMACIGPTDLVSLSFHHSSLTPSAGATMMYRIAVTMHIWEPDYLG